VRAVALLAFGAAVAGCGGSTQVSTHALAPSPSLTPALTVTASPTPTGTAVPAATAVALARPLTPSGHATLDLIDVHGVVISQAVTGITDGPQPAGWGRHGLYLYDKSTKALTRLELDGSVRSLGTVADTPVGLAEAPDTDRWIYSLVSWNSSGSTATSMLYIGAPGQSPQLITTLTRPNFESAPHSRALGGYRVLRWDPNGVLLGSAPIGVGGNGPFIDEGYGLSTVVRLNPATAAVSQPLVTACRFADTAADGTIACVDAGVVEIIHPDGSTTRIDTGGTRVGQVAFVESSSTVVYCVAAFTDSNQTVWTDTLYVVHLGPGLPASQRLSPQGSSWHLDETFPAFDKVVDATTIAQVIGTADGYRLALVDLGDGHTTPLGPLDKLASYIVGAP
jgi:hypothetical protein